MGQAADGKVRQGWLVPRQRYHMVLRATCEVQHTGGTGTGQLMSCHVMVCHGKKKFIMLCNVAWCSVLKRVVLRESESSTL